MKMTSSEPPADPRSVSRRLPLMFRLLVLVMLLLRELLVFAWVLMSRVFLIVLGFVRSCVQGLVSVLSRSTWSIPFLHAPVWSRPVIRFARFPLWLAGSGLLLATLVMFQVWRSQIDGLAFINHAESSLAMTTLDDMRQRAARDDLVALQLSGVLSDSYLSSGQIVQLEESRGYLKRLVAGNGLPGAEAELMLAEAFYMSGDAVSSMRHALSASVRLKQLLPRLPGIAAVELDALSRELLRGGAGGGLLAGQPYRTDLYPSQAFGALVAYARAQRLMFELSCACSEEDLRGAHLNVQVMLSSGLALKSLPALARKTGGIGLPTEFAERLRAPLGRALLMSDVGAASLELRSASQAGSWEASFWLGRAIVRGQAPGGVDAGKAMLAIAVKQSEPPAHAGDQGAQRFNILALYARGD